MFYHKIIFLLLFSLSLFALDNQIESDKLFKYSDLKVNESVSLYAGKTYTQQFEKDEGYSVGVLLRRDKKSDTEFGLGYIQPCAQIDSLWNASAPRLDAEKEDGMLLFMSYFF